MASQWYCRISDKEFGPVAFSKLVDMICSDELTEDDLVRGVMETRWRPAHTVIGLFREAARRRQTSGRPESVGGIDKLVVSVSEQPGNIAAKISLRTSMSYPINARQYICIGIIGTVISAGSGLFWYTQYESKRFPVPLGRNSVPAERVYSLLGIGQLTFIEYLVAWGDVLAIGAYLIYLAATLFRQQRG